MQKNCTKSFAVGLRKTEDLVILSSGLLVRRPKIFATHSCSIIDDLIGDGSDIKQPKNFFALSMAGMSLHLRNALSLPVRVSDRGFA